MIITHGGPGGFGIRADVSNTEAMSNPNHQGTSLSYADLGNYINATFGNGNNRKYAVMIIVNQACYSGTMMNHLYGQNRILISAADSEHEAWTEYAYRYVDPPFQHFAFIYQGKGWWGQTHDGFILTLGNIVNPSSIKNAYDNGVEAANINIQNTPSYPQIDDNFNGLSAEDGDNNDGAYASKIYL